MKKNKIILFLILLLVFSITSIYASWIISNSSRDSTSSNFVTSDNDITITIKYRTYGEKEPTTVNNTTDLVTINGKSDDDKTKYDNIKTFCDNNSFETTTGTQEKIIDGYLYHLTIEQDIKSQKYINTYYYGKYTLYMQEIITIMSTTENNGKVQELSMKKGANFSYDNAKAIVTKDISDYTFLGFCDVNENAITSDTVFNNNTEIYAYFNSTSGDGISQNSITDVIQETTDASIYLDHQTEKYNIRLDKTFFSQDNSIRLGNGTENETITISNNIKFCLNDGSESKQAEIGDSNNICTPFHSTHKCHYKIILDCDLIIDVNGSLLLGGFYGSGNNTHIQSNLREFVCLDLNGHTITVNGTLNSYGFIMDSVGTGEIIVNGTGTLTSIAVIYDYKGGTSTNNQNSADICPFQVYNMPYLQCTTKLIQDDNGWGNFKCYISLNPVSNINSKLDLTGGLKKILLTLNVLGTTDDFLFKLSNETKDGSITMNYQKIPELSTDNYLSNNCYDGKLIFDISKCNLELSYINLSIKTSVGVTADINTISMNFPISPFIDFNAYNNSSIKIAQKIKLLPGVNIYLDNTSSLIFTSQTVDKTTYYGSLSVLETSVYKYNHSNGTLIKNNTYVKADGVFYINNFWDNVLINKYFGKAKVLCNGTIYFTEDNSEKYQLSGLIDFNEIGYIDTNKQKHTITYSSNENPFAKLKNYNCNVQTYALDLIPSVYADDSNGKNNSIFYARPLISHNIAYAYDSTNNIDIVGEYDINTGILTSNDKTYFFYVNEDFYDVSTINCYECTVNNDHTITYNNQRYAFFGNIFIAINDSNQINYNKFYYSADALSITISYDTSLNYWYKVG